MHNKLKQIINKTKQDLIKKKKNDKKFQKAFLNPHTDKMPIIAEIKFASPSKGNLKDEKSILERTKEYEKAGVVAISIVTEKHFFKGSTKMIKELREITTLPILQKDFVIDQYQIYEAKGLGADAVLIIAKILKEKELTTFVDLAINLGIEPVVEVNSFKDLKKALKTSTKVIAVNARDLDTFKIDISAACKLLKQIPKQYIKLGFSGVQDHNQIKQYREAGVDGVLVGTLLMKAKDISGVILSLQPEFNSQVKVKICATRSLEAAELAAKNGAEFIGFVFTPKTKTHSISLKTAMHISRKLKGKINLVGVFQNMSLKKVQKIIKKCNLDYAQFHGDESPEYLEKIKIKKIKAFRFPGKFNISKARKQMKKFKVDYYLIDRIKQSEGPIIDLADASKLAAEFPLIFAGGLNPENISQITKIVKPQVVDVASGVETNGYQDLKKIKDFIKNAKEVRI